MKWYIVNTKKPYYKVKEVDAKANSLNIAWIELDNGKRKIIGRTVFPSLEKANAVRYDLLLKKFEEMKKYDGKTFRDIQNKCRVALENDYKFQLTTSHSLCKIETVKKFETKDIPMFMNTRDFTYHKSEKTFVKNFGNSPYPEIVNLKSHKTGVIKVFKQDQEFNMKNEFFDGVQAVYFSQDKTLKLVLIKG